MTESTERKQQYPRPGLQRIAIPVLDQGTRIADLGMTLEEWAEKHTHWGFTVDVTMSEQLLADLKRDAALSIQSWADGQPAAVIDMHEEIGDAAAASCSASRMSSSTIWRPRRSAIWRCCPRCGSRATSPAWAPAARPPGGRLGGDAVRVRLAQGAPASSGLGGLTPNYVTPLHSARGPFGAPQSCPSPTATTSTCLRRRSHKLAPEEISMHDAEETRLYEAFVAATSRLHALQARSAYEPVWPEDLSYLREEVESRRYAYYEYCINKGLVARGVSPTTRS